MCSVSVGVVLSQRRTQLTGIEPAMGCDSGPPLNRNWVGRYTSCVSYHRPLDMDYQLARDRRELMARMRG